MPVKNVDEEGEDDNNEEDNFKKSKPYSFQTE